MDIDLVWTTLCRQLTGDPDNNSLDFSLLDLIDSVRSSEFPVNLECAIFAKFEGTPGSTTTCAPRVVTSDGHVIYEGVPKDITLSEFGNYYAGAVGVTLRLPRPGFYRLEWMVSDKVCSYTAQLRAIQWD